MSQSRYHDLVVWQKSRVLASTIYGVTRNFPKVEVFGLTQQMRRAAVSVVSNIAEGQGRQSVAEIVRFLVIARGSLYEIEAQTTIAADLKYLSEKDAKSLGARTLEAIRLINGLIRHYEARSG